VIVSIEATFAEFFPIASLGFLKHFCTKYFQVFLFCSNFLSPECYISQAVQCNVVFGRAATRQASSPHVQSDILSTSLTSKHC